MTQLTTQLEEFQVIGISVRTTNQNQQSQHDIGTLFSKFMTENIFEKIPNKESTDLYCLYTDYESDHLGAYTTIIGCRVSSLPTIPDGLVGKSISKSNYQVYKSVGKLPDCVGQTWMKIWGDVSLTRKYTADFDIYGPQSFNPANAEVETYVSIR